MTNPTQHRQVPDALRLAEEITNLECSSEAVAKTIAAAADELCRLHVENASLRASPTPPALSAAPNGWESVIDEARSGLQDSEPSAFDNSGYRAFAETVLDAVEEGLSALAASPTPPAEQAAPKAEPEVGNSGFDYKTAADFLNGKTVSDEAVRKFVAASRWAHDERAALSATLLAMHGVLASREAEIALLKKALLEAAPQQEAQEPAAYVHVPHYTVEGKVRPVVSFEKYPQDYTDGIYSTRIPLYTAPQPAPAPLSDDAKDAARYRWLRNKSTVLHGTAWLGSATAYQRDVDFLRRDDALAALDAAIDAAIAAQGGKDAE